MCGPPPDAPAAAAAAVARLRNLHDGEQAIPEVVRCGELAVPELESLLRAPSQSIPHSRCWAADALAGIGGAAAVQALLRALRDSSLRSLPAQLQEAEAVVLGRIAEHLSIVPGEAVSDALFAALLAHRSSPSCVQAVGRRHETRSIPLLMNCLFEDSSRMAAAQALAGFGAAALGHLCRATTSSTWESDTEPPTHVEGRAAAAGILGEWLSEGARDAPLRAADVRASLLRAVHDPQRTVRLAAAIALARARFDPTGEVADLLVSALEDTPWPRLESVMDAIQSLGARAFASLSAAISAPGDPASGGPRRVRAIELAGRMKASSVAPRLAVLADAPDAQLRLAAIRSLARMTPVETAALARYLGDPLGAVRRTALLALSRHDLLSVECHIRSLADPDRRIRRWARLVLHRRGPRALAALRGTVRSAGAPAHGFLSRWRLFWRALAMLMEIRLRRHRTLASP